MDDMPCDTCDGRASTRRRRFVGTCVVASSLMLGACAPAALPSSTSAVTPAGASAGPSPSGSATDAASPPDAVPSGATRAPAARWSETGEASWYGPGFAGRLTANGETFDPSLLTAAHPTLPFDTRVTVTLLSTGRSVVVRINDRGPFAKGRIVDLSRAAAEQIGLLAIGVGDVRLTLAGGPSGVRDVRVDDRLVGYDVVVPGAALGSLLVVRTGEGLDLVVRAVSLDPSPIDESDDGTEIWVSRGLAERVGRLVTVIDDAAASAR